jgi:hypothetical protein
MLLLDMMQEKPSDTVDSEKEEVPDHMATLQEFVHTNILRFPRRTRKTMVDEQFAHFV